jgi:hypothetical protein
MPAALICASDYLPLRTTDVSPPHARATRSAHACGMTTLLAGQTYERRAIAAWLAGGGRTCPTTGQAVSKDAVLIPNMVGIWVEGVSPWFGA